MFKRKREESEMIVEFVRHSFVRGEGFHPVQRKSSSGLGGDSEDWERSHARDYELLLQPLVALKRIRAH